MNNILKLSLAIIGAGTILSSCNNGGSSKPKINNAYIEYVGSTEMKTDFGNFAEMMLRIDNIKLTFATSITDGKITKTEYNDLFTKISEFEEKSSIYQDAYNNITSNNVFEIETPTVKSLSLVDACADFINAITNTGTESRERTMEIFSKGKLSDSDRKQLYEDLPNNYKKGETDYKVWWKKFSQGEYDGNASHIYNEFYHNPDSDFGTKAAIDFDETIGKIVVEKGAELTEKGLKLEIEFTKAVIPSELADGIEYAENITKTTELVTNMKNMSNEEIADAITDIVPNMKNVKETAQIIGKYVGQKSITSSSNYQSNEMAKVNITDTDNTKGQAIVAINKTTGSTILSIGQNENQQTELSTTEAGNYIISIIDQMGDKFTQTINVVMGEIYDLTISTNESAILEESEKSKSENKKTSSNDDEVITENSLIGSWSLYKMHTVYNNGKVEDDYYDEDEVIIKFDANGIFSETEDGDTMTDHYTYNATTKQIIMDGFKIEVVSVSNTTLVLKLTGTEGSTTSTYTRYK